MRTPTVIATSAATAFLVASIAAPATPKPARAPNGTPDATLTIHALSLRVDSLERDAWDWRAFERCVVKHYRVPQGSSQVQLRFKVQAGCLEAN